MSEYKLGYKRVKGKYSKREFLLPAFDKEEEFLKEVEIRYPLLRIFLDIKKFVEKENIHLFLRRCEEKALKEMIKENQVDEKKIRFSILECPENLVKKCECKYYGIEMKKEFPEDYRLWEEEFLRCIKCTGCIENCPVCFCEKCILFDEFYVKKGEIPPEFPVFHLIKVFHMAGRCVECNLCFELCPALLPINYLTRKINKFVKDNFGYEAGSEEINPLFKKP